MTYIRNPNAWRPDSSVTAPDPELETFVITRLAELVVVLFRDHVGLDATAIRDRAEGRAVMLALGDTAADHGHPQLMPILHDLAEMIDTPNQMPAAQRCIETPMRRRATLTYQF